jgi:MEMO1 family protein
MTPPDDPTPKRLIIPGAESAPAEPPRLIVPGGDATDDAGAPAGDEPPSGPRRIVLPPGVASAEQDVPEYPRLRPLVLIPFHDAGRDLLLVQDPLGVVRGQPVLGAETYALLEMFDGTTSVTDITAALMRESKDLRIGNVVRDFVAKLDELLLLESPRFEAALQELRDAYHPLEVRQAAFDGRSYPARPDEARAFVDAHYRALDPPDAVAPARTAPPRALLAPHLDPRRAGPAMAHAYREVDPAHAEAEPLRFVVLGTGHSLFGDLFALTRKHFETPFGAVRCDTAFVDAVAKPLGAAAYRSELAHREEHSIEFQALYLAHRFGGRPITIVPVLCGGFHTLLDQNQTPRDHEEFEALIAAIRDAERALGGRTVYVAGVDFSHVGPRFGDPRVEESVHAEVEGKDRAALDAAARGDADAWFQAIAAHDDSTRICGLAPTYALLRCAEPGPGTLLRYERSDEPDTSFVSIAAMVWG